MITMANEDKKDFNAMLHKESDMPRMQIVTDEVTIKNTAVKECILPRLVHAMNP